MEFTKTEQKILSPQHERWEKVMLWMGIVCLIFSAALIPYTINNIRKAEKKLTETQFNLSPKIETATKREARLKELLIKSLAKTLQNPPSACRGDECMPYAEGYKGGAKTPLSTQALASLCYNMMDGTEEVESCGLRHGIPSGMVPEISEEDI